MKLLLNIIPLTSLLSLRPRDPTTPSVAVVSYLVPECSSSNAGPRAVHTPVSEDNCTALTPTASFQTFLNDPCPDNTTAESTIYSKEGCEGANITETDLGPVSATCIESPFIGKSALFTCVES